MGHPAQLCLPPAGQHHGRAVALSPLLGSGTGHTTGEAELPSSGALATQEAAPAWDPPSSEGRGSAGWERRAEGVAQGRHLHCRGWQEVPVYPLQQGFPLQFPPSLLISAACRRSCQELLLCPHVCALPVLPDHVPSAVCSALPCTLSVCAGAEEQVTQALMKLGRGCCCLLKA